MIASDARGLLAAQVVVNTVDLPGVAPSAPANWELLREVSDYLVARHPERFEWAGPVLRNKSTGEGFDLADRELDPLDTVARLVQVTSPSRAFGLL